MITFTSLISTVALFAAMMIPGFVMGKMRRIHGGAVTTLGNLLSDIAMPALVFVKLLETDMNDLDPIALIICILLPAAVIFSLCFISHMVFRPREGDREHASARFCAVFSNCGFLGIPLAAALFPESPQVTLYVSLANVTSTFLLLTLGMNILSVGEEKNTKSNVFFALLRPVTLAVMLGFVCSALGLGAAAPRLVSYFDTFSRLTTPLSMTVLGFELSETKPRMLFRDRRVYGVAAMKLAVSPLLSFALLLVMKQIPVIHISPELSSAMLIATAVSTAASASAMARCQGIKGSLAASATLVNTLLCVITLPLLWLLFDAALI